MSGLTGTFDFRLEWTPDSTLGCTSGARRPWRDFDIHGLATATGAAPRCAHRSIGLFCGDAGGVAFGELTCLALTGVRCRSGVRAAQGAKMGLFSVVRIVPDKTDYENLEGAVNREPDIFVWFSKVSWNKWNFSAS